MSSPASCNGPDTACTGRKSTKRRRPYICGSDGSTVTGSSNVPAAAASLRTSMTAASGRCGTCLGESASARQVARRMGLAESPVRAIDLRYLERWAAKRRKPPLRQMGVDALYRGKKGKFLTVVCNLETG